LGNGYSRKERQEMLRADVSYKQYVNLLRDWSKHGLTHIHFTGGEATLHPRLADFVRLATENNILSSLTSNGTADYNCYRELVTYGLTEIRISLDLADEQKCDELAGIPGTFPKVWENVKKLAALRDSEFPELCIILNSCVGRFNLDKIRDTLPKLLDLGPDDLKLLVIAEDKHYICSQHAHPVANELVSYARDNYPDLKLLQKKIGTLFDRHATGLHDYTTQCEMHNCFIPLTERTLDARGYYPCSIYLRCHGKALISTEADFKTQQKAINDFVKTNDCREDEICQDNCTNCCKKFNLEVNRRVNNRVVLTPEAGKRWITIAKIFPTDMEDLFREHEQIQARPPSGNNPFLIIKPQGLLRKEECLEYLAREKIEILAEKEITDWARFSLFLYFKKKIGKNIEFRVARNRAYHRFEEENRALLLLLAQDIPENRLFQVKYSLRDRIGEKVGFFYYGGEANLLKATCVHAPNYADLEREHKVISYFQEEHRTTVN